MDAQERAAQLEIVRAAAREAGRDADALEYTRWEPIDMTPEDVEAHARNGTTRLVVATTPGDLRAQLDEISAFAAGSGSADLPAGTWPAGNQGDGTFSGTFALRRGYVPGQHR